MARKLEERGIATCCFAIDADYIRIAVPPRYLLIEGGRQGYPLGEPNDIVQQMRLVEGALKLISEAREYGEFRVMK